MATRSISNSQHKHNTYNYQTASKLSLFCCAYFDLTKSKKQKQNNNQNQSNNNITSKSIDKYIIIAKKKKWNIYEKIVYALIWIHICIAAQPFLQFSEITFYIIIICLPSILHLSTPLCVIAFRPWIDRECYAIGIRPFMFWWYLICFHGKFIYIFSQLNASFLAVILTHIL